MKNEILLSIMELCCAEFDISAEVMRSKSRLQEVVYARKAFCAMVREKLDLKNDTVGKFLKCSGSAVSKHIVTQPENRYYRLCVKRIRSKLHDEKY